MKTNTPLMNNVQCCVAADSLISIADGSKKRASDIKIGDNLLNETTHMRVTNVIQGYEKELMYLSTENGHELRATFSHPILTDKGFMRVDELTTAIRVKTEGGLSRIEHIYSVDYNATVYNFMFTSLTPFICNGIFVGDFEAQNRIEWK